MSKKNSDNRFEVASPAAAFGYAAVWMVAAAITSGMLRRRADGSPVEGGV